MKVEEKTVTYTTKNSYATLNELTDSTKNIWIVFHGIGFLSRYFLRLFSSLTAEENYIIAPQAPSKYYIGATYQHVGASWLTKENTAMETENVLAYVDSVIKAEKIKLGSNLIVFGFSQGVSIATRWIAKHKIPCKQLVLYAGGIPHELKKEDFGHIDFEHTQIKIIYGNQDEFMSKERLKQEKTKIGQLFGNHVEIIKFEGGHEVKVEILQTLV
ncbi:MAG: esterase [Bacteroidota bacterium]